MWAIWMAWSMLRRPSVLGHVLALVAFAWLLEGEAHDPAFFTKLMGQFNSLPVIRQVDGMVATAMQDFVRETSRRLLEALSGRGGGDIPDPLLPSVPFAPGAPVTPSLSPPLAATRGGPPFPPSVQPPPRAPLPWDSGQPGAGATVVVVPGGQSWPSWRSGGGGTVVVVPGGPPGR